MHAFPIRTRRMELVPATVKLYLLDLHDRAGFATALSASVPEEWPPEQVTREVIEEFLKLMRAGDRKVWSFYWLARKEDCNWHVDSPSPYVDSYKPPVENSSDYTLVGSGGFLASARGVLELGYSVLPAYQRQGYATEAVNSMVEWAFSALPADRIIAYTYPHLTPSIRVLEKNRFNFIGEGPEGNTIAYELHKKP